jgi:hypothetical protein
MNWGRILRFITNPSYLLTITAPVGQNHATRSSRLSKHDSTLTPWQPMAHPALERAREAFAEALGDVNSRDAACLTMRIRYAHSIAALWHLRSDVFLLIALHHNEQEASNRLKALNQHFPERSGRRSEFMSLPD